MQTEPPKGKRRWFQFSLRTLLIGVTLLAVPRWYIRQQADIVAAASVERHPSIAIETCYGSL